MTFWDTAYRDGSYREHWTAPRVPPELISLVEDEMPVQGATVLDVGCGDGLEAAFLARRGCRVLGLDLSPSALVRARGRGAEVLWCAGRARELPVPSDAVDLVLDRGCFHLFEPDTRPAYAAEITRVLRPGGRFFLRGARRDAEELGLFGINPAELDALFPPARFRRGPLTDTRLEAAAGDLEGTRVVLRHR